MFARLIDFLRRGQRPKFALPDDAQLTTTRSGLRYHMVSDGDETGRRPRPYDKATVRYVGWTSAGRMFDASYPRTATFPVDRVIKGFSEGLQLMREGAVCTLVIPPQLGYGRRGVPPRIGPDETLVFHVELIEIT